MKKILALSLFALVSSSALSFAGGGSLFDDPCNIDYLNKCAYYDESGNCRMLKFILFEELGKLVCLSIYDGDTDTGN